MTERYQRHALIDWFDQKTLQKTRVIVVGAGAVGNEVIKNLALLGIGHIHICDFDRIEEHNLTRAVLFREEDVGRDKAEVAAEACGKIDPNIQVQYSAMDFWDGLSLSEIEGADGVICCVDNYEARIQLNQLCMLMGTDFYNTAMDSRYVAVEAYPFSTEPECACYECTLPASVYAAIDKRYSCGWLRKIALEEDKIPTTAVTSAVAGSIVVSMMMNRVNQHPDTRPGAVRYFQDVIACETTSSVFTRNETCVACGSGRQKALHTLARRWCAEEPDILRHKTVDGEIVFSEPIMMRTQCVSCGCEQEFYETTRALTDAVTFCSHCRQHSNDAEFVEALPIDEFAHMFSGRRIPCKFLTYRSAKEPILIEMED